MDRVLTPEEIRSLPGWVQAEFINRRIRDRAIRLEIKPPTQSEVDQIMGERQPVAV